MERKELLKMSLKEIDRFSVIENVLQKKIKQRHAARQLELSTRQVKRLCRRVKREGAPALVHGLRGKPSNHQLPGGLLERALKMVSQRYPDFGPTHANEKLQEKHKIQMATPTLRQGMIQEGLWKPHQQKVKHRAWRQRRSSVGELIQVDGSEHDWFEGRGPRCVLVLFIDDATSRILYGEFVPSEDTYHLLRLTQTYLRLWGRPVALYVDKDSIYKVNRQATVEEALRDSQPITQYTRAMTELDIDVICANSPQAKGRVERSFKTHQDRLVKELRLARIATLSKANLFLWKTYFPEHNKRYGGEPASAIDAHRPLHKIHNLEEILSVRMERTVFNNFTVRFQNHFYQLFPQQPVRLRPGQKLWVEQRLDGSIHLRFKGQSLGFKDLPSRPYTPGWVTQKAAVSLRKPSTPYKPPPDHPWRSFSLKKTVVALRG